LRAKPPEEALSATLVVHLVDRAGGVVLVGEPEKETSDESSLIRIQTLGPENEVVSSVLTPDHTWPVAPGHYTIAAAQEVPRGHIQVYEGNDETKEVTVSAGQTVEITVYIQSE
jgi:hypothetical protein